MNLLRANFMFSSFFSLSVVRRQKIPYIPGSFAWLRMTRRIFCIFRFAQNDRVRLTTSQTSPSYCQFALNTRPRADVLYSSDDLESSDELIR